LASRRNSNYNNELAALKQQSKAEAVDSDGDGEGEGEGEGESDGGGGDVLDRLAETSGSSPELSEPDEDMPLPKVRRPFYKITLRFITLTIVLLQQVSDPIMLGLPDEWSEAVARLTKKCSRVVMSRLESSPPL